MGKASVKASWWISIICSAISTGLLFIKSEMEPATLVRTAALVHFLDAILCRVIAGQSGRQKFLWTSAGLLFGIWALGTLFLLPAKKTRYP